MMTGNGIIESKVYPKLKTKKDYSLTEKGKRLLPMLVEMILWSAPYEEGLAVPQSFIDKAKTDKAGLLAMLEARLK